MNCLISVVLRDSNFQTPQYVERIQPIGDTDSGFRFYLGCEITHSPQMIVLENLTHYLMDMQLYDLLHDLEIGYRVDMLGSIPDFPNIQYNGTILRFSSLGLIAKSESQNGMEGMTKVNDNYMIPFKSLSLDEKKKLSWKDRSLIKQIPLLTL